ncbi:hypothetical protein GCM10007938_38480 [Vibrio zhanjiangensis]|uniref:Uncharacterized protein n=1 Tax=Vibrio zhanjiangensis TaxID=1046128 RepID=A0ABQ6F3G6_9VIBR|nr:hypothetical protein [Vibrio zhanjiangensis]GLT20065.1 hypothetical protein GCM10007938_38480 [Vibrio zhanjiangensis]
MITNNITNALLSGIEQQTPQVAPQNVETYLATIEKAQKDLEKVDPAIALVDEQPADSEVLAMVAAHQKQVVQSMVSSNPEDAIALTIAASIEAYSAQLEAIEQQTKGLGAFEDAMEVMWEDISQTSPLTGYALEDAFQLVLMDVLIHADDYHLSTEDMNTLQRFMECGGSGMHGSHEYYNGDDFADDIASLFNSIYNQAPPDSLAYTITRSMSSQSNCPDALVQQFEDNWGNLDQWYDDWNNGVGEVSPLMRMALLSSVLADESIELTSEEYNMFLTGSLSDIDAFMTDHYGKNTITYINSDLDGWNYYYTTSPNEGTGYGMNFWSTQGVTVDYFTELSKNLPARPLTDEELKEINRIGDQVKMLQQTLKYWLQICRDEQMAIARNI